MRPLKTILPVLFTFISVCFCNVTLAQELGTNYTAITAGGTPGLTAKIWTNNATAALTLLNALNGTAWIASNGFYYIGLSNGTMIGNSANNTRIRAYGSQSFPGDCLIINTDVEVRLKNAGTILTFTNATTPSAPGLILNGGLINCGDAGSGYTIQGLVQAAPGTHSYLNCGNNDFGSSDAARYIDLKAQLSGSGDLELDQGGSTAPNAIIDNSANTFSGQWFVKSGYLQGNQPGSLGTNNIIVDPFGLLWNEYYIAANSGPSVLEVNYNIGIWGGLYIQDGGVMKLHQNCAFGSVTINGTPLANGTYSYSTLVNMFPAVFVAGGSGAITVGTNVPPPLPPIITQQPVNDEVFTNVLGTLNVSAIDPSEPPASASVDLTYRWQLNGTNLNNGLNISGVTNSTLVVTNTKSGFVGPYDVVVTSPSGFTTSSVVNLTIVYPSGEPYEAAVLGDAPVDFYELNETNDPAATNAPAWDFTGGRYGIYGIGVRNGNPNYNIAGPQSPAFPGFTTTNTAALFANGNTNMQIILPALNLNTNTVTIAAWVNPSVAVSTAEGLVMCRTTNGTQAGLGYTTFNDGHGNNTLGYTWNTNVWNSQLVTPSGIWSFVVLSVTPTNATIYVLNANGLASNTHVFAHVNQGFSGATLIGDDSADGGSGSLAFSGTIDDVAIFNYSLSASQVTSLYNTASSVSSFAPTIVVPPPTNVTLYVGETAQFSALAGGTQPLGYHWQSNSVPLADGGNISGSASSALTIANVTLASAGNYAVAVTNSVGSITSSPAILNVLPFPSAYAGTNTSANPVAFYQLNETNVDPATGQAVAYDYVGGHNGAYGTGVQNGYPTYDIAGPTPSAGFPGFPTNNTAAAFANGNAASQVIVPPLNLNTNTVTLSAWIYPTADQLASVGLVFCRGGNSVAGLIYSKFTDASNNRLLGYNWNNDPNTTAWNSGILPPYNQWSFVSLVVTPTNATIYLMNTNGIISATHTYNHPSVAFDGNTLIGDDSADGDAGGILAPGVTAASRVFSGDMADVSVFNSALSQTNLQNIYDVGQGILGFTPRIVSQPSTVELFAGQTANIAVTVSGSAPLSYQWTTNNVNLVNGGTISGVTTPTLTINNASVANSGSYTLTATNLLGSTNTSLINLVVLPTNGYSGAIINSGAAAYWLLNETNNPGTNDTAYDYVGGFNGTYGPSSSAYDGLNGFSGIPGPRPSDGFSGFPANNLATEITGYAGNPGVPLPVPAPNPAQSGDPNSVVYLPPLLFNTNTMTFTAWIYPIGGQNTSTGLIFSRPGSAAGFIYCNGGNGNGYSDGLGANWANEGGSTGWNPGSSNPSMLPPTNQWSFVALVVTSSNLTIYVINTNYLVYASQTVSNAYFNFSSSSAIGYDNFAANRIFNGNICNVALFQNSLSQSNILKLFNAASTVAYTAPSITTQPLSQTNSAGSTAQFTITATGAPPLSYQWQSNGTNLTDVGNILGSATMNLTISALVTNNAGNYRVIVTNYLGSVTSSVATLTVLATLPPVYITNLYSGGAITLSWPQGVLLQATNLLGPWVTNPATSPYMTAPTNNMMFYRIKVQ